MTDRLKETWPCPDCGHKHYSSQECADHRWHDTCPYEGLDCRTADERAAFDAKVFAYYEAHPEEAFPPPID